MKKFLYIFFLFLCSLLLSPDAIYAQCAMCKATAENSVKGEKKVGLGLNSGILLLLSTPYVAAAVVGVLWYRNSRQRKPKEKEIRA